MGSAAVERGEERRGREGGFSASQRGAGCAWGPPAAATTKMAARATSGIGWGPPSCLIVESAFQTRKPQHMGVCPLEKRSRSHLEAFWAADTAADTAAQCTLPVLTCRHRPSAGANAENRSPWAPQTVSVSTMAARAAREGAMVVFRQGRILAVLREQAVLLWPCLLRRGAYKSAWPGARIEHLPPAPGVRSVVRHLPWIGVSAGSGLDSSDRPPFWGAPCCVDDADHNCMPPPCTRAARPAVWRRRGGARTSHPGSCAGSCPGPARG